MSQPLLAADKKVQSLEEINADLKVKKSALEPFDPKKVKVDLESLGLDDVEKKPEEKKSVATELELPTLPLPDSKKPVAAKAEEVKKEKTPEAKEALPEGESLQDKKGSVLSKIQSFLHVGDGDKKSSEAKTEEAPATSASDIKKPTEKYINSKKKQNLKKRLEAEKKRKWDEKKQQERSKKLQELRKKYIEEAEIDEKNPELQDEDFDTSEKILPQRKDLNHFLSEDQQPLPILERYRTSDNLHIPIILTLKERVDILFYTISIGSVSAFNEDYKDIQNPNVRNEVGDTILTCAILLKKYPIIASVLGKGANPNLPNKLGYNPLSIAIELLDFKSFELLANNKADLNYVDAFGRTYLMHAARLGFLPGVGLLVSRGVDINVIDNDGFTALAIAYRHKQEAIAQYLLKHGAKTWVEKPYNPQQQSLIRELEDRWQKQ